MHCHMYLLSLEYVRYAWVHKRSLARNRNVSNGLLLWRELALSIVVVFSFSHRWALRCRSWRWMSWKEEEFIRSTWRCPFPHPTQTKWHQNSTCRKRRRLTDLSNRNSLRSNRQINFYCLLIVFLIVVYIVLCVCLRELIVQMFISLQLPSFFCLVVN